MSLVLTIIKSPSQNSAAEATKTFSQQGGTIGRGKDNSWVMSDPERYLSTCHSEITYENDQYFLTDLSTNGTFFNGSREPMGKGNRVQLKDSDHFTIGDYEIKISLWSSSQPVYDDPFATAAVDAGPFSAANNFDADPFAMPLSQGSPFDGPSMAQIPADVPLFTSEPAETDPLAALDRASSGFNNNASPSNSFATHSDQANALNQAVNWPNAIPDDWADDLDIATPVVEPSRPLTEPPQQVAPSTVAPQNSVDEAKLRALENVNNQLQAELDALKQQMSSMSVSAVSPAAATTGELDMALVTALGIADKNLSDADIRALSATVGELMRETITGLMQVLSSRSSIKNEFRMNVTTIQPIENNPLKFSANVDDALENMFIKKGNSYKKPVEAIRESFDGIAEHQVAILAGVRSAFKGIIERFDPQQLAKRFEKQSKASLIPGSQKAKNWDLFNEYYMDLIGDMDNSFQYLFGDEFVRAYEDQLQRLAIARKSQNK
ncbi:MAG: type VI secretion system-associated FHA domain protein TagH [Gammaproteobacteria bacterium]|nr:type VI secretion system-associated FHA domain protein TagH [Gammaproteobacteria bacterium]